MDQCVFSDRKHRTKRKRLKIKGSEIRRSEVTTFYQPYYQLQGWSLKMMMMMSSHRLTQLSLEYYIIISGLVVPIAKE